MTTTPITLQINLSPGDVGYAHLTIPALIKQHARTVTQTLLTVDGIYRPWMGQRSLHQQRLAELRTLLSEWEQNGLITSYYLITEADPLVRKLAWRYLRPVFMTHGVGTPLTTYALPLELIPSGYWLHYDADMLLYQDEGYDWVSEGITHLQRTRRALAVTPRVSPPVRRDHGATDRPSEVESDAQIESAEDHWRVYWFSTRCFLTDVTRFRELAPFVRGRYLVEVVARRLLRRSYPPSFELMVHNSYCKPGHLHRVDLRSERAYLLHPVDKGARFQALLPEILRRVAQNNIPTKQRGAENILLSEWESDG